MGWVTTRRPFGRFVFVNMPSMVVAGCRVCRNADWGGSRTAPTPWFVARLGVGAAALEEHRRPAGRGVGVHLRDELDAAVAGEDLVRALDVVWRGDVLGRSSRCDQRV